MRKFGQTILFVCGLLLTLAAFPVCAQQQNERRSDEINNRPFEDLIATIKEKVDNKRVDLTKPFSIELEGTLGKNGRLERKTTRFIKSEGDAKMIDVAKTFVEAVNASGIFGYLKQLGVEKINFALAQDDNRIYASVVSELAAAQKAKTIASGLDIAFQLGRAQSVEAKRISEEEKILLGGATAKSANKMLTINFDYEKSVIQELIKRKLDDAAKDK